MLLLLDALRILQGVRAFSSSSASYYPKLKTHSGTKKRWTALPNGAFKRGKAMKAHLNTKLSASRLNRLGQTAYANKTQARTLRRLMPYG